MWADYMQKAASLKRLSVSLPAFGLVRLTSTPLVVYRGGHACIDIGTTPVLRLYDPLLSGGLAGVRVIGGHWGV